MLFGLSFPFQRRRSRWEKIKGVIGDGRTLRHVRDAGHMRDSLPDAARLRGALPDAARLREILPDPADLARRAQPLVDRVAAARSDVTLPEAPAFLSEGLDRLASALGRKKPSAAERALNADVPLWLALGIGLGALVAGFAIGQAAAGARVPAPQLDLEGAADKIKERWPAIHDDDIRDAAGNLKRLSSVVAERTGENARAVRERIVAMTGGQSANGGASANGKSERA